MGRGSFFLQKPCLTAVERRNLLDSLRVLRNLCACGTPAIAVLIECRVHEHAAGLMETGGKPAPITHWFESIISRGSSHFSGSEFHAPMAAVGGKKKSSKILGVHALVLA